MVLNLRRVMEVGSMRDFSAVSRKKFFFLLGGGGGVLEDVSEKEG